MRTALVGLGALGTVAAEHLARSGEDELVLLDYDVVEERNLGRQALYTKADVGRPKALAAKERLLAINPDLKVTTHLCALTATNAALLDGCDRILDGTDNFQTRFVLNEYARREGVPFTYCAAVERRGMVLALGSACLECVFGGRRAEDDCAGAGLDPAASRIAASLMVASPEPDVLLSFDLAAMRFDAARVERRPDCPVCGGAYKRLDGELPFVEYCRSTRSVKVRPNEAFELDLDKVASLGTAVERHGDQAVTVEIDGVAVFATRAGYLELETTDRDVAEKIGKRVFG